MRDAEAGQQSFRDHVQWRQDDALLAFQDHHAIAEVLGVLLDGREFGQRVLANEELLQRGARRIVQGNIDQLLKALSFGSKRIAYEGLQCGVAWPYDALAVQKDHQFGQQEPGRHIRSGQKRRFFQQHR